MTACLLRTQGPVDSKAQVSIQPSTSPQLARDHQSSTHIITYGHLPASIRLIHSAEPISHPDIQQTKPPPDVYRRPVHQIHLRNQPDTRNPRPLKLSVAGLRKVKIICRTSKTPNPMLILPEEKEEKKSQCMRFVAQRVCTLVIPKRRPTQQICVPPRSNFPVFIIMSHESLSFS